MAADKENLQADTDATIAPRWCPEQQIYIGGIVPHHMDQAGDVEQLLEDNHGSLLLFGYGSLCWNPGSGVLSDPSVLRTSGRAMGYRRCWAQKSADHRGTPTFPGIVCTLLREDELPDTRRNRNRDERQHSNMSTEGLIYTVPPDLVADCLAELDFREKGGYARDVIDVIEDESGNSVKALLYRGTPDNPAFWSRALLDLPFAAAIMAVAVGPSGRNDEYLYHLNDFLTLHATTISRKTTNDAEVAVLDEPPEDGDMDTISLAAMVKTLQEPHHRLYFLFGSGSNQHNQLCLASSNGDNHHLHLVNGDDMHELTEIIICSTDSNGEPSSSRPKALYAGGGHSGLLTENGQLYLWGWNEYGQLGSSAADDMEINRNAPLPMVAKLKGIDVEHAAFGFSHTLVIEKGSNRLYAFGDNGRGQVDGITSLQSAVSIPEPTTPEFLKNESFLHVDAGLFHSAAITSTGELVTFGCGKFGQSVSSGRWRPDDGSRLVLVACGRRHTVILDEHGRVWTLGENKYGQLGRQIMDNTKFDGEPRLVEGLFGSKGSECFDIQCGWSHTIVSLRSKEEDDNNVLVYGWGRNDKGQLGLGHVDHVLTPIRLFATIPDIDKIICGSESTMLVDKNGIIWGCGWNEHGNLSLGNDEDTCKMTSIVGPKIVAPPPSNGDGELLMASGGAHFLAMRL